MRLFLSVLLCTIYLNNFSQNLVLKTDTGDDIFHNKVPNKLEVNKPINLQLVIEGVNKDIIKNNEGYEIISDGEFVYKFIIVPEKEGNLILGPYSLEFNGQNLTSNNLSLYIKAKQKSEEIRVVSPKEAKKNTVIKIELISNHDFLKVLKVKESADYSFKSSGSSTNKSYINGKVTNKYSVRFTFVFNKTGIYKFDESMFYGIPEELTINAESILIE